MAKPEIFVVPPLNDNSFDEIVQNSLKTEPAVDASESISQKGPPRWLIPLLVTAVVLLIATGLYVYTNKSIQSEVEAKQLQAEALVVAETQLSEAQEQIVEMAELAESSQLTISDLESELAIVRDELVVAIDPEVVKALEASEAALIEELRTVKVQFADQTQALEQLQVDLDVARQSLYEMELEALSAQASANAEAVRANQARTALGVAHDLVPERAEGVLALMSEVTLESAVYYLGRVSYLIDRPGLADNETQYFVGTGEIGLRNSLDQVRFTQVDTSTLQVDIPLPRVEASSKVMLDGTITTDREQFARIGARWGEQTATAPFVEAKAKDLTRTKACQDARLLRREMTNLVQIVSQLSKGYKTNIRWVDKNGSMRTIVTDQQLVANAC